MSVLGELLITAAVILLLFAAYTFFWTNVRAHAEAGGEVRRLQDSWGSPKSPATGAKPAPEPREVGRSLALLYLPRLGSDWVQPVKEGSGDTGTGIRLADLTAGLAHYPDTAKPGEKGNFALAGHRATHGEPFRDLDRVREGDLAVVQTRSAWLVYRVTSSEIVPADALDVLLPVPRHPSTKADKARLTLTTCHPRWGSTSRLIVYAELAERRAADSPPTALLAGS